MYCWMQTDQQEYNYIQWLIFYWRNIFTRLMNQPHLEEGRLIYETTLPRPFFEEGRGKQWLLVLYYTSVSGYDLNWLEDPPDDLKCLICLCVARDPHQHPGDATNECGIVFCHSCITKYQRNKKTCPNCRKGLTHFKDAKSKSQKVDLVVC